ncbi:unnamed protein product [Caenorhabditis angaria]|uniref:Uncharacterized protein n=1 Tax=Caenorhabditis angaria TaxID=860376 RepID=A0A9P1IEE5_9PELO|nr:unnamed protein product [Caenorhabditis angaria]
MGDNDDRMEGGEKLEVEGLRLEVIETWEKTNAESLQSWRNSIAEADSLAQRVFHLSDKQRTRIFKEMAALRHMAQFQKSLLLAGSAPRLNTMIIRSATTLNDGASKVHDHSGHFKFERYFAAEMVHAEEYEKKALDRKLRFQNQKKKNNIFKARRVNNTKKRLSPTATTTKQEKPEFFEKSTKVILIVDPPFGVFMEPLLKSIDKMKDRFEKTGKVRSNFYSMIILPIFIRKYVLHDEFWMSDYRVTYSNHKLYSYPEKTIVRIFTNLPKPTMNLKFLAPDYKYCAPCQKWVTKSNDHCEKCENCTNVVRRHVTNSASQRSSTITNPFEDDDFRSSVSRTMSTVSTRSTVPQSTVGQQPRNPFDEPAAGGGGATVPNYSNPVGEDF